MAATKAEIMTATAYTFNVHQFQASDFADNVIKHQPLLATSGGPPLKTSESVDAANKTAAAWQKDNTVIDRFAATLASPKNKPFLDKYHKLSPADATQAFLNFSQNPRGLANDINRFYSNTPEAHQQSHVAGSGAPAPVTLAAGGGSRPASGEIISDGKPRVVVARNGERHVVTSGKPSDKPEPATTISDGSSTATLTSGNTGISPAFASSVVEQVITHGKHIYGDEFAPQEKALRENMAKPGYAQKVAAAINADPALVAELNGPEGGDAGIGALVTKYDAQDAKTQEGIRNGLHASYKSFLEDPTVLADKKFRDGLTSAATSGGLGAKINGFFQGIFGKDFDFSKILSEIGSGAMQFLKPLFDMIGNLFSGFKASGGMSNVMTMGNSPGQGMFGNFMSGLSQAATVGQAIDANERFINAEGRVVERVKDGKLSDGMVFNADGSPHMIPSVDKKTNKAILDENNKPVMEQEYNQGLDDRIQEGPGKGRYEISSTSISDGHMADGSVLRAYASKVDFHSGQIVHSEIINIGANGSISRTNPETNEPITTKAPSPATPASPTASSAGPGAQGPQMKGTTMQPSASLFTAT